MFAAEVELASPVVAWLHENGSSCIAHEVEVGAGIPDLVAGMGPSRKLRNRRRQADPITDAVQLAVLEYCRTARTEADLRSWAPHGFASLAKRALSPLVERALLESTAKGFRALKHPLDPFVSLNAVELKLSASERGFAQAYSYRVFADASYFAVPAGKVTPVAMDRARELGIGLLAVHPSACEEVVEPSEVSLATAGRRRVASERVLAASQRTDGRIAGSRGRNLVFS
ncbi:hypothetical protein [Pseudarthrobacter sp.]|uniref:hypothetical protein n=1 Tax=Pseudarthrobacter sp. TaxID=1934409 RepID=UPI002FCB98FA